MFCRGGSKGIPNKNVKSFHGYPLISWAARAAVKSKIFDELILSTDSNEIAKVGRQFGFATPFIRPKKLAQDKSDQFDAHKHAIEELNLEDKTERICILNNNPFINKNLIKISFNMYKGLKENNIVVDAIKTNSDYIFYRQMLLEKGLLLNKFKKEFINSKINRQDTGIIYSPINNIRWGKPSWFLSYNIYKNIILERGLGFVELPKIRNFDLDEKTDWSIAEAVFKILDEN